MTAPTANTLHQFGEVMPELHKIVTISYKNWKGVCSWRRILPLEIWFGMTKWHPKQQYFLKAQDLNKNEVRDFAMSDINEWKSDDIPL